MAFQSGSINPTTTSPASDITKITNDLAVLRSVLGGGTDSDVPVRLPQTVADAAGVNTLFLSSGNLGVGVSLRTWGSTHRAIEVAGASTAHVVAYVNGINVGANYYNGGSGDLYASAGQPAQKFSAPVGGGYQWSIAPAGTVGNAITWAQAMTMDTNGNLGVGATNPDARLRVDAPTPSRGILGNFVAGTGTNGAQLCLSQSGVGSWSFGVVPAVNAFAWYTGRTTASDGTELMRLDGLGQLTVTASGASARCATLKNDAGAVSETLVLWNAATTGNNLFTAFCTETAITTRGSIDYNRAGTAVRYNTTSDRRLKENIQDAPTAGGIIDAIKVRSFDWRESGTHTEFGFIAQELVEHVPDAVRIGDDAEELGPKSDVWAVDFSKLVPLLVKEVQTLRARVAALEATHTNQ